MGLRFRHSFQLFPGVRLNLSKSGLSASFGVPGATLNVGPRGVASTIGIPGTGLSYHTNHSIPAGHSAQPAIPNYPVSPPSFTPSLAYAQAMEMREINSASVEQLTSDSLVELRDLIHQARTQRGEIEADLKEARQQFDAQSTELNRRQRSLFRMFYKRRIAELEEAVPETEAEIERLTEWQGSTHIDISFETSETAQKAYGALVRAFETLKASKLIWDITSDRNTNRVIERTSATRTVTRTPVKLDYSSSDLVRFAGRAIQFQNVNGEDIMIYPGVVLMPRGDGAFALIELRDIDLRFKASQFVEEEGVPADAQVTGHTWAKVNKDGSPDRRFANNYQIPIVLYGTLVFTSPNGVEEEYQFSNAQAAADFSTAFDRYKAALFQ